MPDPRSPGNQFYDAMPGLGGRGGPPSQTPPMRLPQDMVGPSPPQGPMPLMQMQGNPLPGITEDDYYGPPTPEMMGGIDLAQPPMGDPGAMEQRQFKVPPGKAFVD